MTQFINLKDNHFFLTSHAEVDAILQPLKQHFGVTSLVYQRNYLDGSEIRLTNQPQWVQHFFEKGYYLGSGFEKHPTQYQTGFAVWSHLSHHQPILNAARLFNIDHGITLIQKKEDGCEFYFIGTTPDRPYVTNLLLNNIDTLQRFTLYFKEQAEHLLKKSYAERIYIPRKYELVNTQELGILYQNNYRPLEFKIKKFHLDDHITLTAREMKCAKLIIQGKTARSISEELFISQRTVETHILHLKEKLKCQTKTELIAKLINFNIAIM
jgi:DNA-binding CsgD family transcriptional regulator